MALRDQPYIPLYIQDFLTDEKLIECSASATGVYVRLMCIMHKSDKYGKILLKQKDKQTDNQINNFALKVAKQMPYSLDIIIASILELLTENVLYIDGDLLCQKRMVKDNELNIKRSESGKLGGIKNAKNIKKFAIAKSVANSEYENDNEIISTSLVNLPIMTEGDFLKFNQKLLNDDIFTNPLMMGRGIKNKEELKNWIIRYDTHISGEGKINKDYSEYRKHFKNWILKQDTFNGATGKPEKKMVL